MDRKDILRVARACDAVAKAREYAKVSASYTGMPWRDDPRIKLAEVELARIVREVK